MHVLLVLVLILLNGLLAMAEIAIVSVRKVLLKRKADSGDRLAEQTLALADSPNRFLSTVQIGITFVGVFAGAYSADALADPLTKILAPLPVIGLHAGTTSFLIVVSFMTYLSLVIGELVPKRLAMNNPERVARALSGPMTILARAASPLVSFLSWSTDFILRLLSQETVESTGISEEEVTMLVREGTESGVFDRTEKDIVERTFRAGDKYVNALMTPRQDIVWLDHDATPDTVKTIIADNPHSNYPVCRGNLDDVIGTARTEDILSQFLRSGSLDYASFVNRANFIPETMAVLNVLEMFKKTGIHQALVVDEYGSVLGLVTLTDIMSEIVGDIPEVDDLERRDIVRRENGTFLVDGLVSIDEFSEYFRIQGDQHAEQGAYHTVGGLVMQRLGHVPNVGDRVQLPEMRLEVVDMDGHRVDKVLITPKKATSE